MAFQNTPAPTDIEKTYDDVPYDSHAFAQTHPLHLQSVATLFGLNPPALGTARVLELGCASGGNLLAMALRNPQADFVGIDLSSKQIAAGLADVAQLGLKNIKLQHRSITDMSSVDGLFDYIICHGVYSWVPAAVQNAILHVCSDHLTPTGVAYVSYNTYPGWKGKEIVRDAMLYRAQKGDTPQAALAMAKGMVDFLAENAVTGTPLKQHMLDQQALMKTAGDSYLQHEFLESYNLPCYFEQFVERAAAHGLAYLSESEISTIYLCGITGLGSDLPQKLLNECGGNQVAIEQYMDYLRNRTFRQTLLVHSAQTSQINYNTPNSVWMQMHYQGAYTAHASLPSVFTSPKGVQATLPAPWHRAVAQALTAASPATLSAAALLTVAQALEPSVNAEQFCQMLSQQTQCAALRISAEPCVAAAANTALVPSALPKAEAYVRAHASVFTQSAKCGQFTNVWHEHAKFFEPYAAVLAQCDGETPLSAIRNPSGADLRTAYQYGLMAA